MRQGILWVFATLYQLSVLLTIMIETVLSIFKEYHADMLFECARISVEKEPSVEPRAWKKTSSRRTYGKRDLYILERDLCIWKSTYKHENRLTHMKRDLCKDIQTWKKTCKQTCERGCHSSLHRFLFIYIYISLFSCKRELQTNMLEGVSFVTSLALLKKS